MNFTYRNEVALWRRVGQIMAIWEVNVCGVETDLGGDKSSNDGHQESAIAQEAHQWELQDDENIESKSVKSFRTVVAA